MGESAITIVQGRLDMPDPHDCTDSADALALLGAVFDALVQRSGSGKFEPALAHRWSVSADATTWRFELRPQLTFHDGVTLDAHAVKFSIERMMRPEIGATLGAPAVWGQYLSAAVVSVKDPLTVELRTEQPCADLLDVLSCGYVLPPHLADKPGFAQNPVGSGAYRVASLKSGHSIAMSVNSNWWGKAPANPRLLWRCIPDNTARLTSFLAGEADVATRLDPAQVQSAQNQMVPDAATWLRSDHIDPTSIIYLLNCARGPFRDPRLRRAINLAVNRQQLIDEVLAGSGQPLSCIVSPVHLGAVGEQEAAGGTQEARRLLIEAGFGDGLELSVDCPTRLPDEAEALTAALARQLTPVGIHLTINLVEDRTEYAERVRDKQIHDLCLFDSSPMSTFRVLHEKIDSRQRGSWWQGYRNDRVEQLVDSARRTVEHADREALYRQACLALQTDPPWLVLYNQLKTVLVSGRHPTWSMRSDGILKVAELPSFS